MRKYLVYIALLVAGSSSGFAAYLVAPLRHATDRPSVAASYPEADATRARMARLVAETAAREAARTARERLEARAQVRQLAAD